MVRDIKQERGRSKAPAGRAAGRARNLSRPVHEDRPLVLLADRRRLWFATSLAGSTAFALLVAVGLIATRPGARSAPTIASGEPLRTLTVTELATRPSIDIDARPEFTGSSAQHYAAMRPDPIHVESSQPPPLRGLLGEEVRIEPTTPPAERAARKAIKLAALVPFLATDRPTVLSDGEAPAEIADNQGATNRTVLVKRMSGEASTPIQEHTIIVAPGDTFYDLLDRLGVATAEAVSLVQALAPVFPPQNLRAGQEISVVIRDIGEGRVLPEFLKLTDGVVEASVGRGEDGTYFAQGGNGGVGDTLSNRVLASISGSLYSTARAEDVPDSIIVRMMHTHSYDVDFQREIKAGDTFEVFYRSAQSGREAGATPTTLLFSSLTTGGKTRSYYRFEGDDGATDYYDAEGTSSKKPLMKTPIDGARISSGFGLRKHPILGYTKLHGGTDFAAPTGTPILAAGDGIIDFAGRNGGYGNYVRLTHKDGLKTAYAHMSRVAKGVRPGKRVKQGQIIGFVGSTGRSTGPHLHYEIHLDGKKTDPVKVKVAGGGRKLEGEELARFQAERQRIDTMRTEAPITTRVAAAKP